MADSNEEFVFNNELCARVRQIRVEKGWVAEQMAIALAIPVDRYRKYETRSVIPHYLIPRLALIADRSIEWVMTGKEPKTQLAPARSRLKG